jgi:hypothetical protein
MNILLLLDRKESLTSLGQRGLSYDLNGGQDFSFFCRTGINILLMFDREIPLSSVAKLGCSHLVRPERSRLPFKGVKRCSLLQNRDKSLTSVGQEAGLT